MAACIDTFFLVNGLEFTVFDRTRPYYGDYHRVLLEVVCDVPLHRDFFVSDDDFIDGRHLLGESVRYCRILEKMAVPFSDLQAVRDDLLARFRSQAECYLALATFPVKLVRSECEKARKRRSLSMVQL